MSYLYYTLLTLLIIVALLMIGLILIQKGRGGGLSSAFGGGGGSAAFGAKTGDVLTWLTSGFFAVFIILAILLDLTVNSQYKLTVPKSTVTASAGTAAGTPAAIEQKLTPSADTSPQPMNDQKLTPVGPPVPAGSQPVSAGNPTSVPTVGNATNLDINALTKAATTPSIMTNPLANPAVTPSNKTLNMKDILPIPTTQPK